MPKIDQVFARQSAILQAVFDQRSRRVALTGPHYLARVIRRSQSTAGSKPSKVVAIVDSKPISLLLATIKRGVWIQSRWDLRRPSRKPCESQPRQQGKIRTGTSQERRTMDRTGGQEECTITTHTLKCNSPSRSQNNGFSALLDTSRLFRSCIIIIIITAAAPFFPISHVFPTPRRIVWLCCSATDLDDDGVVHTSNIHSTAQQRYSNNQSTELL